MIWEEMDKNLILTGIEADSPNEVFELLGQRFIDLGYSEADYVDALKEREAQFPTGLDIMGFGVAIPHTDAGHVRKETVGIATLQHPVRFIQMGSVDTEVMVHVVFMLGIRDPKSHIQKLQRILRIIQDDSVLSDIKLAKDSDEIIRLIKQKEIEIGGETL